jgi:glutamyl/glutaminyl-tRNA synthetase
MYEALGFKVPQFAHLPMILSSAGGKLSKRFGATSIKEYREEGFLAKAIVNYLLLLGWSPGNNQEIIPWEDAAKLFKLEKVNKTAAVFSFDKFTWINAEYIKRESTNSLVALIEGYLKSTDFLAPEYDKDYLARVVGLLRNRMNKLSDFKERAYCFFKDDFVYAPETEDILKSDLSNDLITLKERLYKLDNFDKSIVEQEFRATAKDLGLKAKDLVHPVRVALTGNKVGPGLFETMEVLGKKKVSDRISRLINRWKKEAH